MRIIDKSDIGPKLALLLDEKHSFDEDIGIVGEGGFVAGVIITKEAYAFFLRKVEEEEDRIDRKTIEDFDRSGEKDRTDYTTLEDFKRAEKTETPDE